MTVLKGGDASILDMMLLSFVSCLHFMIVNNNFVWAMSVSSFDAACKSIRTLNVSFLYLVCIFSDTNGMYHSYRY